MSNNSLSFEFANGADSTQVQEQVVKSCSSSSSNLKEVVEVDDEIDEVDEIDLADFKYDYHTGNPALFVSSYKRYNDGKLDGCWIDLTLCSDYDEFQRVCRAIVSEESDPEFMFSDCSNLPEVWYSECCLDEDTFDLIKAYGELDEDEQRAYEAYLDLRCESDITVEDFREHYCGEWHSEEEFAENLIEELGILDEVPEHLRRFFDMEAYARELFDYDYDYTDSYVFRVS